MLGDFIGKRFEKRSLAAEQFRTVHPDVLKHVILKVDSHVGGTLHFPRRQIAIHRHCYPTNSVSERSSFGIAAKIDGMFCFVAGRFGLLPRRGEEKSNLSGVSEGNLRCRAFGGGFPAL